MKQHINAPRGFCQFSTSPIRMVFFIYTTDIREKIGYGEYDGMQEKRFIV